MSLFDFPSSGVNDLGSLLSSFAGAASNVYVARLQAQQQRRATRGGRLTQAPGWGGGGGAGEWAPSLGGLGGGVVNMPPGAMSLSTPADSVFTGEGGDFWGPLWGDSPVGVPGSVIPGEGGTMAPGTYYDRCGRLRQRKPPTHPGSMMVQGTDGKTYEYKSIGRALLSTLDMAGYRKVCSVAHRVLGGAKPATSRRRRKAKRSGKRRKVACKTLTPKQLAAGFGGAQYRR